jgi:hypothetical protein
MLEVGKRYESPRTGTWVKIAERSGGNLTFERGFAPEIRRASPPVAIQKLSLPLLAAIGPLRGYEPAYDWAEKARPMKASERRKRRRALVSWRIVNPVARSLAGYRALAGGAARRDDPAPVQPLRPAGRAHDGDRAEAAQDRARPELAIRP